MTITLSKNTSEKNKIAKTIGDPLTLTGNLRSETSIINPSIMVEHTNPTIYNYAYIPDFGRYYFIENITAVRLGLWQIDMSVDVLMSFASSIKALPLILKKTENTGKNFYLSDDAWLATQKSKTDILTFPSGLLDSGEYILITAGGVAT